MRVLFIAMVTCLTIGTYDVMSQPAFPTNPNQAPIDGGLGLLAAAGGAYAYKKLRKRNDHSSEAESTES